MIQTNVDRHDADMFRQILTNSTTSNFAMIFTSFIFQLQITVI